MVCAVPRFIAKWLMLNPRGQRVKLPGSWVPYLFGRALGVDGSKCTAGSPGATLALASGRSPTDVTV